MPRAPQRISPTAIERIRPYADEQSLRDTRIRTTPPWSWVPQVLGAGATTLGNDVCFRPGAYRETDPGGLALIAHECFHVRQYREMGAAQFLVRYLVGAIRVGFQHSAHPLELEPLVIQAQARAELAAAFEAERS
jgi:hypothetical protein